MGEGPRSTSNTADREIVLTRVLAAPRVRVFQAWADAKSLETWWGPQGFTTTTHAFDFRPGGEWKHTVHGPDGALFPSRVVYDEIVRPERIVLSQHGGIDGFPALFQMTVTLVASGKDQEVTMRQVYPTAATRDAVIEKYGAVEGGNKTLARLADRVTPAPELRMTRVLDAPRRRVFEAWSQAESVSRFFTPAPLTTSSCDVDFRPGGALRVVMRTPDGLELPFDGRFEEVVPHERIVFSGKVHDDNEVWTELTFAERDGKTTLSVRQVYLYESNATRGASIGWTQTLTQLGEVVAAGCA